MLKLLTEICNSANEGIPLSPKSRPFLLMHSPGRMEKEIPFLFVEIQK